MGGFLKKTIKTMKKLITLVFLLSFLGSKAQDTSFTAKAGKWTLPSTWIGGKTPKPGNHIVAYHKLTIDTSISIAGLKANDLLVDPNKELRIVTTENIVIKNLTWKSSLKQEIIFEGINENDYRGGGMDIPKSDKGLYITGNTLVAGSGKTPWTNLKSGVAAGDSIIKVNSATGWKAGDRIVLTATNGNYKNFDTCIIKSTSTTTITLLKPLTYNHNANYNKFTKKYIYGEVLNLTRNLKISGTPTGRAHIIFLMAGKQMISNLEVSYMGPRKNKDEVLGRYNFHFHHCGDGSIGSVIKGVVVRDGGSNGFVPHASNGILFEDDIVWGLTWSNGYWWDFPDSTMDNSSHGITFNRCVAGNIKTEAATAYSLAGFVLGVGTNNTVKNCIVNSNYGAAGSAGYLWPARANYQPNTWVVENNMTHDVRENGLRVWQNDSSNHVIKGFVAYNCMESGMSVGAYHQNYHFDSSYLISNKYSIVLHANPIPKGDKDKYGYILSFYNIKATDSLYLAPHTLINEGSTGFVNCSFPGVIVSELPRRVPFAIGFYDFINCNLLPSNFKVYGMEVGSLIKIKNADGSTYEIKQ